MTLQSLARTIAKARHGTDAMWADYMGAAEAVVAALMDPDDGMIETAEEMMADSHQHGCRVYAGDIWNCMLRALIAQPDGVQ